MIAIFAGIISNVTAESMGFGPVAPFVVALLPLVVCGILVVRFVFFSLSWYSFVLQVRTWEENYGNRKSDFSGSCMEGLRIIFKVGDFDPGSDVVFIKISIPGRKDLVVGVRTVPVGVLHVHLRLPLDPGS